MQSAKCKVPACILQQFQFILPLCFFGILTLVSVGFVSVSVSLVAAVIFLHATRDGLRWCSTSFVGRFRTSYLLLFFICPAHLTAHAAEELQLQLRPFAAVAVAVRSACSLIYKQNRLIHIVRHRQRVWAKGVAVKRECEGSEEKGRGHGDSRQKPANCTIQLHPVARG